MLLKWVLLHINQYLHTAPLVWTDDDRHITGSALLLKDFDQSKVMHFKHQVCVEWCVLCSVLHPFDTMTMYSKMILEAVASKDAHLVAMLLDL